MKGGTMDYKNKIVDIYSKIIRAATGEVGDAELVAAATTMSWTRRFGAAELTVVITADDDAGGAKPAYVLRTPEPTTDVESMKEVAQLVNRLQVLKLFDVAMATDVLLDALAELGTVGREVRRGESIVRSDSWLAARTLKVLESK